MNKSFILVGFLLIGNLNFAQIPNGYYDAALGLSGNNMKSSLHSIIDNHSSQSYSSLWYHFEDTDQKSNGKVWDMYSDVPGGTPPYQFTFGSDQCGSYSQEGDCYNREHSFPASWFNDASPMYTDLFHLIPSDGYVNGQRSNYPFGEVGSASWTSLNGSKKGSCSYPGYSGTVFEPIDEYKGDLARGYFYMATRYMDQFSSFNSPMLSGGDFATWARDMLIEWHQADPVSDKEIDRNNAIYSIQNNRNPYIDHPEFVECVWLNQCNYGPTIANISYSPSMPGASDDVVVTAQITDEGSVSEAILYWCADGTSFSNSEVMTNTSGDTYSSTIVAQSIGTEVSFKIEATDNDNDVTESSVNSYTVGSVIYTFIDEDFTNCPPTNWIIESEACADRDWQCNSEGNIEINAFGGEAPADDWLITPAVNLDGYLNAVLTFETWTKYSDAIYPPLTLEYSTDYTGGDPSAANWSELSFTTAPENSETWTSSGDVDLSAIEGEGIYFAFHYISTGNDAGSSSLWKVDNVLLTGEVDGVAQQKYLKANLRIVPNPNNGQFTVSLNGMDAQSTYECKVFNSQMQMVYQNQIFVSAGNQEIQLDLSRAANGLYFVQLKSEI